MRREECVSVLSPPHLDSFHPTQKIETRNLSRIYVLLNVVLRSETMISKKSTYRQTPMLQEMANAHKTNLHHQPNAQPIVFLPLPMLCSRSSFKDVKWVDDDEVGSDPSRDEDEPLSPKVGCMGQVKRNSRVVGFPTPNSSRTPVGARAGGGKHSKLKRMFSAAAVAKPATPAVNRCRAGGRSAAAKTRGTIDREKEKDVVVSIVDMDPPRPVTWKVKKDGDAAEDCEGDRGSLWKRRSGGRMDLKKLELQNTCHNQGHLKLQLLTV